MRKVNREDLPTTLAHNQVPRKALLRVGESRSCVQTINYAWLEKGQGFEPHKHDDCEEFYFFLEGEGIMQINGREIKVKKGDFVVVEKGEWHGLKNKGKARLVFFTVRSKICEEDARK